MTTNLNQLPTNLPVPTDDGAAAHLKGALLPDISLVATDGSTVNLAKWGGRHVIYVYPMTGRPDVPLPDGWDAIPGARGCTPQSCAFRDHHADLASLNTEVFGLSAQDTDYQQEVHARLHLPFQLLSDTDMEVKNVLRLPTFSVAGMELYRRLTLVAKDRKIEKVFYPVFPPDKSADEVLEWLRNDACPRVGAADGLGDRSESR